MGTANPSCRIRPKLGLTKFLPGDRVCLVEDPSRLPLEITAVRTAEGGDPNEYDVFPIGNSPSVWGTFEEQELLWQRCTKNRGSRR